MNMKVAFFVQADWIFKNKVFQAMLNYTILMTL